MNKRTALFLKVFEREWNQRFRLVKANGTPLELPKKNQDEDDQSEELSEKHFEEVELTEEELEEEELATEIGNFLDELIEKEEAPPVAKKQSDP